MEWFSCGFVIVEGSCPMNSLSVFKYLFGIMGDHGSFKCRSFEEEKMFMNYRFDQWHFVSCVNYSYDFLFQ